MWRQEHHAGVLTETVKTETHVDPALRWTYEKSIHLGVSGFYLVSISFHLTYAQLLVDEIPIEVVLTKIPAIGAYTIYAPKYASCRSVLWTLLMPKIFWKWAFKTSRSWNSDESTIRSLRS